MIGLIKRKKDSTTFHLVNPEYVEELEKEIKILNEHLDSVKDFYETELENRYKSIVDDLEEWLKKETRLCEDYLNGEYHTDYTDVLDKIEKLKKKYK